MNTVQMHFSISESKKQANAKLAFANILYMETNRIKRLRKLISENFEGSQTDLSKKSGVSLSQLGQYLSGYRTLGEKTARKIEANCGKETGWLDFEEGYSSATMSVLSAEDSNQPVGMIEYWSARGSCGGGVLNDDSLPKGHLIKEQSFFSKYKLSPNNAFAIYADGDSMADFIVDGDIVIFDKSKKTPISGKIFAIEHPDGLRIKVLRRSIEGAWILESKNVDKRSFPDEVIPADHTELLKIHGQFVYRQGG